MKKPPEFSSTLFCYPRQLCQAIHASDIARFTSRAGSLLKATLPQHHLTPDCSHPLLVLKIPSHSLGRIVSAPKELRDFFEFSSEPGNRKAHNPTLAPPANELVLHLVSQVVKLTQGCWYLAEETQVHTAFCKSSLQQQVHMISQQFSK